MCTLYLLFNAFIKGVYFEPDASYTFGLILPLCSMLTTTLAVFGLLEVGDTILDPFGCDPEDFTVLVSLPDLCRTAAQSALTGTSLGGHTPP